MSATSVTSHSGKKRLLSCAEVAGIVRVTALKISVGHYANQGPASHGFLWALEFIVYRV